MSRVTRCQLGSLQSGDSGKKSALSVPKDAGRRVLYKTSLNGGRPFFGRASVRSLPN